MPKERIRKRGISVEAPANGQGLRRSTVVERARRSGRIKAMREHDDHLDAFHFMLLAKDHMERNTIDVPCEVVQPKQLGEH